MARARMTGSSHAPRASCSPISGSLEPWTSQRKSNCIANSLAFRLGLDIAGQYRRLTRGGNVGQQRGHFHGGVGGSFAGVAVFAAGAIQRLLEIVGGQDAE